MTLGAVQSSTERMSKVLKRIKRTLCIFLSVVIIFTICTSVALAAFDGKYYSTDSTNVDKNDALARISDQSFSNSAVDYWGQAETVSKAKEYISHFINNTNKYVHVPNSGSESTKATDGTYSVTFNGSRAGCLHYASFIVYVMYKDNDGTELRPECVR